MKFDNVIFDFDGTLGNSEEGVINSIIHSLNKMNKPIPSRDVLKTFIGPALFESYMRIGLTADEAERAIVLYRENYVPRGVYQCKLYDGMRELIEELSAAGVKLSVASSKPQDTLNIVTEFLGVKQLFEVVKGADNSDQHSDKRTLIRAAVCGKSPVMVGDTTFDIVAAKRVDVPVIAVSYGFMARDLLERAEPDYIADSVSELKQILFD